jgi:hypothetical protein
VRLIDLVDLVDGTPRASRNRFLSGGQLGTVSGLTSVTTFLLLFSTFSSSFSFGGVFLLLGAILLDKFTGPDWPVRGSSLNVTRDPVLLLSD